ncbi:uncharacterized protein TNCV_3298811 [Trichonephila clavipes]|uniref:CCHC-type domain-containing protein n=1 Tax=Trichonephila clavipes TaxID=2585209 RepID=A0A8X6VTL3_TRICX|nr:uncharacterized protein TNCV_3298811 [Trichonephila clavipes]
MIPIEDYTEVEEFYDSNQHYLLPKHPFRLLIAGASDSPLTVTPHRTLNSCRGVISESDFCVPLRQKFWKVFLTRVSPSPKLPTNIKAGYLNWKVHPYIPNPLRCFKSQRFGHSQTSCRGQLTCSRCASVGHASTDCSLEPKCINCSLLHTADSKLCPKWKNEKQIQEIKTNKNITYVEARKLIVPQLVESYAEAAKPSIVNNSSSRK